MKLSLDQGKSLVKYARGVVLAHFGGGKPGVPENLKGVFAENRGVFVTLEKYPGSELRGCIGYCEPIMPLGAAVEKAAIAAALEDPRFPPVGKDELKNLVVEVSVLTAPELIKVDDPREYPKEVVVGRDGLIVERGFFKGLLLPQVPVEYRWDVREFLSHTCMKAGLSPDMWLTKDVRIYRFSAQVFSELAPNGEVVEKKLGG